jgi:hypothetical protein
VVAVAVPLVMRAGLPRAQRWLEPRRTPQAAATPDDSVGQYGRWVDGIIRRGGPVVRSGCLTRGVTGYYGLRHAGVDVSLCFGMGMVRGAMEGHCWLELAGRPVLEPDDPRSVFAEVARVSRWGVTGGATVPERMVEWAPPTP